MINRIGLGQFICGLLLITLSTSVLAEDDVVNIQQDIANKLKVKEGLTPDSNEILGEQFNLYTGEISFNHTDLSIAGNDRLPFSLGRMLKGRGKINRDEITAFGDWQLDIPKIEAITPQGSWHSERCSNFGDSGGKWLGYWDDTGHWWGLHEVKGEDYWTGASMNIPGQSSKLLQIPEESPAISMLTTQDKWLISCNVTASDGGEGFVARSPKGLKYTFSQLNYSSTPQVIARTGATGQGVSTFQVNQARMMVSKIEDLHGNQIDYTYDSEGRLSQISSSDDSRIATLNYTNSEFPKLITSIVSGNRTWSYSYLKDSKNRPILRTAKLPDGSSWQLNMGDVVYTRVNAPHSSHNRQCSLDDGDINSSSGTITHPNGLVGTYNLKETAHGLVNVTDDEVPKCFDTMALASKSISGANIDKLNWTYSYSKNRGNYDNESVKSSIKTLTINEPDNGKIVYSLDRRFDWREGSLMSAAIYQNSSLLRTITNTYAEGSLIGDTTVKKSNSDNTNRFIQFTSSKVSQGNNDYLTTNSLFDSYNNPQKVVESNGTEQRTTNLTYYNNTTTTNYTIGMVKSRSISELVGESTVVVDSRTNTYNDKGQITAITDNGVSDSYEYIGTLLSKYTDAREKVTSYSNYHRGIPKNVTYAIGNISHLVDDFGNITKRTDQLNLATSYTYDKLDRVKSIDYPIGTDTTFSYGTNSMTRTRGTFKESHTLDVFNRSILVKLEDSGKKLTRYKRFAYNKRGLETYQSQISDTSNASVGLTTVFDVLERPISITSPSGATSYSYPNNLMTKQTDALGYVTTYNHRAYGGPSDKFVTSISQSLSLTDSSKQKVTAFTRNAIGRIDSVSQGGKTITYGYNNNNYVTSEAYPEFTISYGRDLNGNMTTRKVDSGSVTTYTYDALNRLTKEDFIDSSGDITITYFATGELKTIKNGIGDWTYAYDHNRNMTQRSLVAGGKTYAFNFTYDSLDHLTSMTYPSGLNLTYDPNVFGESTKVGSYVTAVEHHENGIVKSFTYGNNVTYSVELDTAETRIGSISGKLNSTAFIDKSYTYDSRDNITAIDDGLNIKDSVSNISYDGIGQVLSATSNSFRGTIVYQYSLTGNVTQVDRAGTVADYSYDSKNRLSSVSGGYPYTFGYDNDGNITSNGWNNFTYNDAGRMTAVTGNNAKTYAYDALGQRVKVIQDGTTKIEIYSDNNQLLMVNEGGGIWREKIYFGNDLVAQMRSGGN